MKQLSRTACLIADAVEKSSFTQKEIALRAGFDKPNIITMIKQGGMKLPLARAPALAKALGIDPKVMLESAVSEYHPDIWKVIVDTFSMNDNCDPSQSQNGNTKGSSKIEIVPTDGNVPVEFSGEQIASATTKRSNSYRWTTINIYRTQGGKWVTEQRGETSVDGERTFVSVGVYGSLEEVCKNLGYTKLSRDLFKQLGVERVIIA